MSSHVNRLTRRWSERPPAVRLRFACRVRFHSGPRALSVAVAHLILVRPMPRAIFIACLTLAFLPPVFGDEAPPPPLTPTMLRGIWEGVSAGSDVYQFAVEPDGRGCLVFFRGFRPAIYRLVSAKVAGGNVTLRFQNTQAADSGDFHYVRYVTIRGSGRGDSEIGILSGRIEGSPKDTGWWLDTPISFARPPWLKYAARSSQHVRRLLEKARRAIPPKA